MQKRRWLVFGTSLLVAVLLLILWAGLKAGRDARLALIFVGYTNELLTPATEIPRSLNRHVYLVSKGDTFEVAPEGFTVPTALLLATNTGSVALEVFAAISPASFAAADFARPSGTGLPRILKPGESTIIKTVVDPRQGPWWTEISYQRRGLRDRVYGLAWDHGNAAVKAWVGPKISDLVFIKLGPVTNQPPPGYTTPEGLRPIMRPNPRLEDLTF